MNKVMTQYLSKLELGELLQSKNVAIIPLFSSIDDSLQYLTLKEALERRLITITEVSEGGSVPDLKVVSKADIPVLLLDGEELVGAKQNRVLNTSILLKENSETIIPVSCTEQGRWSYVSREFAESQAIMPSVLRRSMNRSVAESLQRAGTRRSDQGTIWRGIDEVSSRAGVKSPTGAMKEVFDSRRDNLDELLKAFEHQPHQKGLLVFVNGEVVGFDAISLESAYETLHPKLVRSYAMDALLRGTRSKHKPSLDKAMSFLQELTGCGEKKYQSIGHGWDYRYEGQMLVGSALVYQEKVVHTAFFRAAEGDKVGEMSGYRRRRGFRI